MRAFSHGVAIQNKIAHTTLDCFTCKKMQVRNDDLYNKPIENGGHAKNALPTLHIQ